MSAKELLELLQTLEIWEEKGVARVAPLSFEFHGNRRSVRVPRTFRLHGRQGR